MTAKVIVLSLNKKLCFIKIHKPTTRTYESKIYRSSQKDCSVCPLKGQCIKNKTYPVKELSTTIYNFLARFLNRTENEKVTFQHG